jgi:hypothetical protein
MTPVCSSNAPDDSGLTSLSHLNKIFRRTFQWEVHIEKALREEFSLLAASSVYSAQAAGWPAVHL